MTTVRLNQINEFLALQLALLLAFKEKFKNLSDWQFLLDFPKSGTVEVDGIEWTFQKHGSGLLFRRSSDGTVVDIHRMLAEAAYIDAWRLEQYLVSLGLEKYEREINSDFKQLLADGFLEEVAEETGLYRLSR